MRTSHLLLGLEGITRLIRRQFRLNGMGSPPKYLESPRIWPGKRPASVNLLLYRRD